MRRWLPLVVLLCLVAACGGGDPEQARPSVDTGPTSPAPSAPSTPDGASPSEPPATPAAAPTPAPSATPDTTGPVPSGRDAARFAREQLPDDATGVRSVAVDLDDDEVDEVVVTGLRDGAVVLRVAVWDGRGYRLTDEAVGPPASAPPTLRVADVNDDGVVELVTEQPRGPVDSLALWRWPGPGGLAPVPVRGGCDGGELQAVLQGRFSALDPDPALELAGTCDESPLPPDAWTTVVWDFVDGAYRRAQELAPRSEPGRPTTQGSELAGDPPGAAPRDDAGESDAGESDAGESDAGESDGGDPDGGESDGGESDSGDPDGPDPGDEDG